MTPETKELVEAAKLVIYRWERDRPTGDAIRDLRAALSKAEGEDGWLDISTAPRSLAEGSHVKGVYLLGYCPDDALDPSGCMSAIWWEPLQRCTIGKRRGMMGTWYAEGGIEAEPTHWQPLPPPPQVKGLGSDSDPGPTE